MVSESFGAYCSQAHPLHWHESKDSSINSYPEISQWNEWFWIYVAFQTH